MISDTNKDVIYKNIICIVLFIMAAYLCQVAAALIPVCISALTKRSYDMPGGMSLFITYMLYVLIFGVYGIKTGIINVGFFSDEKHTGPDPRVPHPNAARQVRDYFYIILTGISLQYLVAAILSCISLYVPELLAEYNTMVEASFSSGIWAILSTALIAPLGEELLFRGLILHHTRQITGPIIAVIINGILFGLYHMNLVQLCYAIPIGILLAAIVTVSHSIYPALILHMAVNITAYMMPAALFAKKETIICTIMVSLIIASICIWRYFAHKTYRDK